ncbi:hypothetical protein AMS68_000133 [Peltaster fructicola]|uniref:Developmental regulatory protein wetA n=1 Tax=Peltaster fructicola TaxID=286661 RepID=A0A6H0XIS0_9PEZI|nr:hypothetical protein AMS68_000133 [Peltaster fructicola]
MAVLRHMAYGQIRQPLNKESDWSGICDTVFDQYTNDDDVFGLSAQQRQSTSSDNSANIFDYSISSGQSIHTTGTSPDPAWAEHVAMTAAAVEAMPHVPYTEQPQPKEGNTFWQKTLKALERNAVESEDKLRVLRTSKSHPDFLSLGGHPSPACVPCPVPDSSFSVPRSRPRESANGHAKKNSTSQLRSISRGRPQGVAKNNTINNASTATMRKRSVSPTKMSMTPSRYRAGFQEAWTNKIQTSPTKYALRMPTHALPDSPPSSAHLSQQDFAAFSSPTRDPSTALMHAYDSELSPLTTTFQQARIHTPDASPFFQPVSQATYFDHNVSTYQPQPALYHTTAQNVLPNSRIASFDFGFSAPPTQESWAATYDHSAMPNYHAVPAQDVFGGVEQVIDQTVFPAGLGISCDATYYPPVTANDYAVPAAAYQQLQPVQPTHRACYAPLPDGMPLTPHKQRMQSRSPSPPMTESRSRRASGVSGQRRGAKHRRAKSTTAIPRTSDKGGFVNFTPDDSNKILSGVAPSGSSKTKARREKEAADRRRRLSLAAVKAVVDAGGNLEGLAQAGLL